MMKRPIVFFSLAVAIAVAPSLAQALSADVMNRAKSNCLTAVAKTVNRPRSTLKIIKVSSNASGASVDVQVPTAQAPWSCLTSPKGDVEDVHFN